ncbi:hypothetical protein ACO2I3_15610 [Leptospira interrogans]
MFDGCEPTAVIEYLLNRAGNYNPANWPQHFTRYSALYLALLRVAKLTRANGDLIGMPDGKMRSVLEDADGFEAFFLTNGQITANRHPVMQRALGLMGQMLAESDVIMSQADKLRWHMSQSWDHCLKYVLERGSWDFASRRVLLAGDPG